MPARTTPATGAVTVLVADDDAQARRQIRDALAAPDPGRAGAPVMRVRIIEATNAADAMALAAAEQPALIVLDLHLPVRSGRDGQALLSELRNFSDALVMAVSVADDGASKARILDGGADDCVSKPFAQPELRSRLRALVRRCALPPGTSTSTARVRFGQVAIDRSRRHIDVHGESVHLTPTEYKLLMVFLAHPGVVLSHQQLFDRVWGRRAGDAKQYLRVYVANIRKKLEPGADVPRFFQTVPGIGYRFAPEPTRHR